MMMLLRMDLCLVRNFEVEWMMMVVLCLIGWSRDGVVSVLLMISGMVILLVMVFMVVMLSILLCVFVSDLVNRVCVFGWIVVCYVFGLVMFLMNVVLMFSWVRLLRKRLCVFL